MTEAEMNWFYIFVVALVRANGGSYGIPSDVVAGAAGDFQLNWELKPEGSIHVVEVVETPKVTPKRKCVVKKTLKQRLKK